MSKLPLYLFVLLPGALGTLFFAYFTSIDYAELRRAYAAFERASRSADLRAITMAEAHQNIHRINVFADGVWTLMCLLLFGMGVCAWYLGERKEWS